MNGTSFLETMKTVKMETVTMKTDFELYVSDFELCNLRYCFLTKNKPLSKSVHCCFFSRRVISQGYKVNTGSIQNGV